MPLLQPASVGKTSGQQGLLGNLLLTLWGAQSDSVHELAGLPPPCQAGDGGLARDHSSSFLPVPGSPGQEPTMKRLMGEVGMGRLLAGAELTISYRSTMLSWWSCF